MLTSRHLRKNTRSSNDVFLTAVQVNTLINHHFVTMDQWMKCFLLHIVVIIFDDPDGYRSDQFVSSNKVLVTSENVKRGLLLGLSLPGVEPSSTRCSFWNEIHIQRFIRASEASIILGLDIDGLHVQAVI